MSLPLNDSSAPASTPASAGSGKNHRILIVDDNEAIHGDFRKILGREQERVDFDAMAAELFGDTRRPAPRANFELSFASQGQEAYEMVKEAVAEGRRYSLVFTDVRMPPGWDGLETTVKLWEVDPDLQVVICTAYSDRSWEDVMDHLGAPERVLILKKPFDTIEVLQLAHALTEKWSLLQASRRNLEELERTVDRRTQELQRAHAELQASEERYRTLNESAPIGIFEADVHGQCRYVNPQWETLSGMPQAAALGQGWVAVIHPEDLERVQQEWGQAVEKGEPFFSEHRYCRTDGEVRWIRSRGVLIRTETGEPKGHVGTVEDITDRRKVRMELARARDAAVESTQLKSRFLANMSHEIRTPMNGIIGMTDLALETDLTREQREYLEMTKVSAQSLLSLINDILDFSKIEAGKLELESISFDLQDCVYGMLKPLALRAEQKGLELTAEIAPEVPGHVLGDPTRLRQILINLIDNAIKFTECGDVMLRVHYDRSGAQPMVQFVVEDTGIGIPASKQEVIFESFAQADGTTTRTHGGTGLGLAIASELVRKMGGKVEVESACGRGTTFRFSVVLPVDESKVVSDEKGEIGLLTGRRVLVVDNNPHCRRIMGDQLTYWGLRPTLVGSASSALNELVRMAGGPGAFSLIIIDAVMPGSDGVSLAEKLHRHTDLVGAKIMVLPATLPPGAMERCKELGMASTIGKPVERKELQAALLEALRGAVNPVTTVPVPSLAPGLAPRLRILLVEDNPINRALATGMIEKRGHTLVQVTNGQEAVIAARDESIDLILMDVQMPEMDGFEATRRIREEQGQHARRIPIVALTAHAMAGDRERCLAAGMDDYLSKPIRKEELLKVIERVVSERPLRVVPSPAPSQPAPTPKSGEEPRRKPLMYTPDQLRERFEGDEEMIAQVAALFKQDTPRLLNAARNSIEGRSPEQLARTAHTLLSTYGVLGAMGAWELAHRLELEARGENYSELQATLRSLEYETDLIQAALSGIASRRVG